MTAHPIHVPEPGDTPDDVIAALREGQAWADAEIARLRRDCADLHAVLGGLALMAGMFDDPQVQKALDNARAAAEGGPRLHEAIVARKTAA